MSTGNGKNEIRAVGVRFEKDRTILQLNDSREVSVPLRWYPSLQKAKSADRKQWELIGQGIGIRWESLDLDLSTAGIVGGFIEAIPTPPPVRKLHGRRTRATV